MLAENGMTELAYDFLLKEGFPSWLYSVNLGATTIWELWNGDTASRAMNSCNHVMLLGDLVAWMYRDLGGINPAGRDIRR